MATLGAVMALQWTQYGTLGTFAEFHAGTARPISEDAAIAVVFNVSGVVVVAATALLLGWRWFGGPNASAPSRR